MIALMMIYSFIITAFWILFFRTLKNKDFSHMPEGYLLHEKSFVWPDSIIVVLLLASSYLLWSGHALGEGLALVAGGMMLFLGVIDIAYQAANEMYKKPRASLGHFIATCSLVVTALVIIVRFL